MAKLNVDVVSRDDLRRRLDQRVAEGGLSAARAAAILSRHGRGLSPEERNLASRIMRNEFADFYRHRRVASSPALNGFSDADERHIVEATIELANARDDDAIERALAAFRLWYDTSPATRDELGEEGLATAEQLALEVSSFAHDLAQRLPVIQRGSAAARKALRDDLLMIPPRLVFCSDYDVDHVGRVSIAFSMIESRLHDAADFACLLMLDPGRPYRDALRRCKYRKCGRYFLAGDRRAKFCPGRTGRRCKDKYHNERTGAERTRRSRMRKAR